MSGDTEGTSSQVLIALGELKGQIQAIHTFFSHHSDRMDRIDKRLDHQDSRMNDFARVMAEHAAEDIRVHESIAERMGTSLTGHGQRIGKVELKIAYWSGAIFVAEMIGQLILKHFGIE